MPRNAATESTCNMSSLLRAHFWQPVFSDLHDSSFLVETGESRSRSVGAGGNAACDANYKILNMSTNKIIHRSTVRLADEEGSADLRANPLMKDDIANPERISVLLILWQILQ